ncbi:MAG: T9SS type A sorting domain-containing protein, partial [Flavobacteriaceae bacterium]|nr:T9SS type A sorting domain-containing protein [Flavobacteriaceae bacterium]
TITINNNDCVKFVYDFAIQGTGDAVLSTNDASLLNQLSNIYPNPNKGSFTLNYSGQEQLKELLVIDMLGKRVQTISLESFANSQDINLTALAKGMYFITIQSDTATITKRMIIE